MPKPPTPTVEYKTLLETMGVPEHITTLKQDPEQLLSLSISKNMWTSNPGYIVRNGPTLCSHMKSEFVYDEDEVSEQAGRQARGQRGRCGSSGAPLQAGCIAEGRGGSLPHGMRVVHHLLLPATAPLPFPHGFPPTPATMI